MWKSLESGERVQMGDIVRYRPDMSHFAAFRDRVFAVIKIDQHYFEVAVKPVEGKTEERDRTIVKYMDVGYHIALEIWEGKGPFMA